jgi:pilus assembly protein CpaE
MVDDDATNARAIAGHLISSGYYPQVPAHPTVEEIVRLHPAVLLVRLPGSRNPRPLFDLCRDISRAMPFCPIVAYAADVSVQVLQQAMEAGVRRLLTEPISRADLLDALRDVQRMVQVAAVAPEGAAPPPAVVPWSDDQTPTSLARKLVVCFSPKGGVGTTTIAVNLAVCLQQAGRRVALVDTSFSGGDVGVFLNLTSKQSMLDLILEEVRIDAEAVAASMVAHESGIEVLLAPWAPEQGENISADNLRQILTVLREQYDYVVVDTPSNYSDRVLLTLELADTIIVATEPALASVKRIVEFLRIGNLLNLASDKMSLVMTRANSATPADIKGIENHIKQPLRYRIVSAGQQVVAAQNVGEPLVMRDAKSEIATNIRALADGILQQDGAIAPAGVAAPVDGGRARRRPFLLGGSRTG